MHFKPGIIGLRVVLATLFLGLGFACGGKPMGEECDAPEACAEGGTCLSGVCSGYTCSGDEDCDGELVCGEVGGVAVCVLPCTGDGDCLGEQTCHLPESGGEGVCL